MMQVRGSETQPFGFDELIQSSSNANSNDDTMENIQTNPLKISSAHNPQPNEYEITFYTLNSE